ncbi:MAG TPA: glycosyltransferase family 4 protein [Candidatus Saccharimonadales bacterium]|nr:glycosyltransferase family 4 protein [Candidatus Saccharimonadales bacterium]
MFDDSLDKPDGVQQYVLTLGGWLESQGHNVHYLVGETERSDIEQLHSLSRNVRVRFNRNRMAIPLPARVRPIRELLAREHFDVLHVQVPYSPMLAAKIIANAEPHTAVVGTFHIAPHSGLVGLGNRMLGLWLRRSLQRFDTMMSVSEPAAAFARRTFGVDSQVVPNPINVARFTHAKPLTAHKQGLNVVFLGRLVERKGCQYLLQAVSSLVRRGDWPKQARVIVCGGGPLEAKLKAFAMERHLEKVVKFVGYISEEDKPRYLAAADVAIYPSTGGESFGIVLLEAMAAARGIVLAGNNPGYASVLAPRPEALFDPQDTKTFAQKLYLALSSALVRNAAHKWQRSYVPQFDVANVGKRTLDVYMRALHKRVR